MEELRNLFPAAKHYTYLNTAANGLLSADLAVWRAHHDQDFVANGSNFREHHKKFLDGVRTTAARFFDASLDEVALIPNFSFGLNTLLEGIESGQKVLLLDKDYPSINWAFEQRDFDICYAEINENVEQQIEQAVAHHKPDIFAFSLVQYLNGLKIDMDFLQQLKAYHPNLLLIADGTQYLGTEAFSFNQSPLDILGASAYKWLLSGFGNGVFMVKEAQWDKIHLGTIGFNSADGMFGEKQNIPFMKHFEPGHQDTLNYGSFGKSLEFLEDIGLSNIGKSLAKISATAKGAFLERDLLEEVSAQRENHSTIFNLKGDNAAYQRLIDANILCSQRGNGIRVGFHIYNTEEDLHRLLSVF